MSETHIHVLYYNARSLLPKLSATLTLEQPHIVCVVETWLSPDIAGNELQMCGYQQATGDFDVVFFYTFVIIRPI